MTDVVDALDNFKDLVWDDLVDVWLDKLLSGVPGLIANIISMVLKKAMNSFYKVFRERLIVGRIGIVNADHENAYNRADIELALIARDLGRDSPEFRKARDAHKKAMSEFTRLAPQRV